MSACIRCDSCKKIMNYDVEISNKEYVPIITNFYKREANFHLCKKCYYEKLMKGVFGLDLEMDECV